METTGKRLPPAWVIDAAVLGLIAVFLASHFPLRLLLTPTITAGGDTPSHYDPLRYLTTVLLPQGHVSGWCPSYYAGLPLLEFYFPLPFLLMALMSCVVALPIAFKLGTLLGTALLPLCAYGCLRLLRQPFPVPALAAVGMLPFLFSEANSIWGGNILSTLAGEFAYSLGLALAVLCLGALYRGVTSGTRPFANAMLLALVGLSHGYPLLFVGTASLCFLFSRRTFLTRLRYLITVHGLAVVLLGFWLLPLLAHLPWTSAYDFVWSFTGLKEMLPPIAMPQLLLAAWAVMTELGRRWRRTPTDSSTGYLMAAAGCGLLLYVIAPSIRVVDVRFLPFAQVALALLAAVGIGRLTHRLRGQRLIPFAALTGTLWWIGLHVREIPHWIDWNYSGYEAKQSWPVYAGVNDRLKGSTQDPRVVYEHSTQHEALGSLRAWESLPLFSGRSTLEHAYLQASPSAPFVFYLQSEISKEISCPFPDYGCTSINLDRAKRHLELFNVRELILVSEEVKSRARRDPAYRLTATIPPYEIYETAGPHRYVTPLRYEPVLWTGGSWKAAAYAWFRNPDLTDVHLVFPTSGQRAARERFRFRSGDLSGLARMPIAPLGRVEWERIANDEVVFETTALHQPHLIKVSYHPNWRVEGADAIYLTSPAFMLVYPNQPRVRLRYARGVPERLGLVLTMAGLCLLVVWRFALRKRGRVGWTMTGLEGAAQARLWGVTMLAGVVGVLWFSGVSLHKRASMPPALLARGIQCKDRKQWDQAERLFRTLIHNAPQCGQAQFAQYHLGIMRYLRQEWGKALTEFQVLVMNFPDSPLLAEVDYHMGLCYEQMGNGEAVRQIHQELVQEFPDASWTRYAQERWGASR